MRHRVGSHENFKTVDPGYQVFFDILAPSPLLAFEFLVYVFDGGGQKSAGSGGGIEYLNFMDFFVHFLQLGVVGFALAFYHRHFYLNGGFAVIGQAWR